MQIPCLFPVWKNENPNSLFSLFCHFTRNYVGSPCNEVSEVTISNFKITQNYRNARMNISDMWCFVSNYFWDCVYILNITTDFSETWDGDSCCVTESSTVVRSSVPVGVDDAGSCISNAKLRSPEQAIIFDTIWTSKLLCTFGTFRCLCTFGTFRCFRHDMQLKVLRLLTLTIRGSHVHIFESSFHNKLFLLIFLQTSTGWNVYLLLQFKKEISYLLLLNFSINLSFIQFYTLIVLSISWPGFDINYNTVTIKTSHKIYRYFSNNLLSAMNILPPQITKIMQHLFIVLRVPVKVRSYFQTYQRKLNLMSCNLNHDKH